MKSARRPACMSDYDWEGWERLNRRQSPAAYVMSACHDCRPSHAEEVRASPDAICDGVPRGDEPDEPLSSSRMDRGVKGRRTISERGERRYRLAVEMMAQGFGRRAIAEALKISVPRVDDYRRRARAEA